jgi:hypothetical protein
MLVADSDFRKVIDRSAGSSAILQSPSSPIVCSNHPPLSMAKSLAAHFTKVPDVLKQSVQATKAEFRLLGRSGLRVSNPILGGLQVGSSHWLPWVLDEEKVSNLSATSLSDWLLSWNTFINRLGLKQSTGAPTAKVCIRQGHQHSKSCGLRTWGRRESH